LIKKHLGERVQLQPRRVAIRAAVKQQSQQMSSSLRTDEVVEQAKSRLQNLHEIDGT
jgi:AmiR/NasT family two-component response regulator